MTKQETQTLKGVAALMIIWCHIFYTSAVVEHCHDIYIYRQPLAGILNNAVVPVEIFLILGGYGLYFVYRRGHDKNKYARILKLFIHVWVVMLAFVPLAHYLADGSTYPGSATDIFNNVTTLYPDWNTSYWFLLPYALISLSSKHLFRLADKCRWWMVLGVTALCYVVAYALRGKYAEGTMYICANGWISLPVNIMFMLFPFSLGYLLCKHEDLWGRVKMSKGLALVLLISVITAKCILPIKYFLGVYALLLILFYLKCPKVWLVEKTLQYLGKHSLNIWLLHGWFCIYLFSDFYYGFKYPPLILAMIVGSCLACSYVVDWICKPITEMLNKTNK